RLPDHRCSQQSGVADDRATGLEGHLHARGKPIGDSSTNHVPDLFERGDGARVLNRKATADAEEVEAEVVSRGVIPYLRGDGERGIPARAQTALRADVERRAARAQP